MVFTTLLQILTGLLLPPLLARAVHRRWGVPWRLLLPGAAAGLAGLLLGVVVQGGAVAGVLAAPDALALPVFAGTLGIGQGMAVALLLAAAFQWLARGARAFPPAAMIAVGFGGAEMMLRAGLAALVLIANIQLDWLPPPEESLTPEEWAAQTANLEAYFATPPAQPLLEAVSALGRIAHGIAVAVLVGTMFLTGEVGWFFAGFFWAALARIGAVFFGGSAQIGAAWWLIMGAVSVAVIARRARRRWPLGGRDTPG
ncbi:MAG: hypothetical protein JXN59_17245 [Anaerolineae bacterium]|nr:hypothetical protein [Anaerolineae bacterium]